MNSLYWLVLVAVVAVAWYKFNNPGRNPGQFDRFSTAEEVSDGVDLTGKVAIVTGPTSGIGVETVRTLAARGCRVVLACRNLIMGRDLAENIKKSHPNAIIDVMHLDLSSFDAIKDFVGRFLSRRLALDILINNAGVFFSPEHLKTADGFNLEVGVNALGHFLLTTSLTPALMASSSTARVVVVSSFQHVQGEVDLSDLWFKKHRPSRMIIYGTSKLYCAMYAFEMNRRLSEYNVRVNAICPGVIGTNVTRHMGWLHYLYNFLLDIGRPLVNRWIKSVEGGASTSVYVATNPALEGVGGLYFEHCNVHESSALSRDEVLTRQVWKETEKVVGMSFSDGMATKFEADGDAILSDPLVEL